MVDIIKDIHSQAIIYRDIKPENFLIGISNKSLNKIHICDFGLAKYYMIKPRPKDKDGNLIEEQEPNEDGINSFGSETFKTKGTDVALEERTEHIPMSDGKVFSGTPRYASCNSHVGLEQSRRDDLESVLYMLIYFFNGSLPWSGLKAINRNNSNFEIRSIKETLDPGELCAGMPKEFIELLIYVRQLKFEEQPNYNFIIKTLKNCLYAMKLNENQFVWLQDEDLGSPKKATKARKSMRSQKSEEMKVSESTKSQTSPKKK